MVVRILAAALICLAATVTVASAQTSGRRADVVVELYTSQGCTQCPRANRLLGMFAREQGVLALTFPVGIWDYLGWNDTFARPEFSDRHRAYTRALRPRGRFTPQLVMNGARTLSASDWDDARAALDEAREVSQPLGPNDLAITRLANGRVRVTLAANASAAGADVWLIAYEPGPLGVEITSGLNTNRTVFHYNLVRTLERAETWDGRATWFERTRCSPECAMIVQAPNGGLILGAAYTGGIARR